MRHVPARWIPRREAVPARAGARGLRERARSASGSPRWDGVGRRLMWRSRPVRGSCPGPRAGGDHLSERSRERPGAEALVRPTRELGRAVLERSLLGLAPGGACRAEPVTRLAGELLPHRFTLTARAAVCSLWRFPRVAPSGCYPAPCPAESGRSSSVAARGRPAGSSEPSLENPTGRIIRTTMRARAAIAWLPVIALAACAQQPVGPAAPIAPAQLAPGPALEASAARQAVVGFIDAYRESPDSWESGR